jgi:hypothetical protein
MESPASPNPGPGKATDERGPAALAEVEAAEGRGVLVLSSSSKSSQISDTVATREKGWGFGEANPISLHGQREETRLG